MITDLCIDPCDVDIGMVQQRLQMADIPLCIILSNRKLITEIMGRYFISGHFRLFVQGLHLMKNIAPVERSAAAYNKDTACLNSPILHIIRQLPAQTFRKNDRARFTFLIFL